MDKAEKIQKTSERLIPDFYKKNIYEYCLFLKHCFAYHLAKSIIKPTDKVLDLGCGDGYGVNYISDTGANIVGIDMDKDTIDRASEIYPHQNCSFELYDGKNLNYPDGYFDVVLSYQVIEHVLDVEEYLKNIKRVLKKDGVFIITTPSRTYRLTKDQKPFNPYHLREYDSKGLKNDKKNIFPKSNIFGLLADKEVLALEYYRVLKARADYVKDKYLKPEEPSDFLTRYSVNDFYLSDSDLDIGLDLVLTNLNKKYLKNFIKRGALNKNTILKKQKTQKVSNKNITLDKQKLRNVLSRCFSVKNEYSGSKKYKVLSVLGVKFKFRLYKK